MVLEQITCLNEYFLRISAKIIILFVILLACSRLVLNCLTIQFSIIAKPFLWDCRKTQVLPNMYGFRAKIIPKYKTTRIISKKEFFMRKWILTPLSLLVLISCL